MIRAHFYHSQEAAIEGVTQQLLKHIQSTRFIIDPYHSCDDFTYQGVFLHEEKVMFSLALPGGETSKKIFDHWREKHIENSVWNDINYYWTDERLVPFDSSESNAGEAYRRFLLHSNVAYTQIHPIKYSGDPTKEAQRYTSQLPSSRGISYDPTRHYTIERPCATPYKSNFHCAILDIDSSGNIGPIAADTPTPVKDTKYYATTHPTDGQKHITATLETLQETPRIIVPLLGKEKAHIIGDLYYRRNTHLPAIKLLLEHPNVHIFTDNRELETTIYPNRRYLQTTPDVIRL